MKYLTVGCDREETNNYLAIVGGSAQTPLEVKCPTPGQVEPTAVNVEDQHHTHSSQLFGKLHSTVELTMSVNP